MKTIEVISPVDGSSLGSVTETSPEGVDAAVQKATRAFESWGSTPVKERVQPLFRFKQLVEDHIDELSAMVTAENGKTHGESKAGIQKGLEVLEYAIALPAIGQGGLLEVSRGVDCFIRKYPLGVVAGITPFNFPAMVPFWMFPLAISTGNTFLLKPSEQVPLTPIRLAELFTDAGLPENVFQVIQGGPDTVNAILEHPGIAATAFVGSTKIAKLVYDKGTAHNKRMLCMVGAKNHLIVVPDADPEITAKNVVSSATGCAGQRCMAASVLITVGNCSHIMEAIEAEMKQVVAGDNMGAIISPAAKARIEGYITRAEEAGANITMDGRGVTVP